MKQKIIRIITGTAALILVIGLLLQLRGLRTIDAVPMQSLAKQLSSELPGWTVRELPVASSPEVRRAMETTLRYDDVLYREYRRGDLAVELYVSVWQPGKMDPREIAIHHPDNCWTANGYERLDAASRQVDQLGDAAVQGGQFRRFQSPGGSVEVAYWLTVEGRPFGYVDQSSAAKQFGTRVTAFLRSAWFRLSSRGRRLPTCFVRVSSQAGLDAGLDDPALRPLFRSLARLLTGEPGAQ